MSIENGIAIKQAVAVEKDQPPQELALDELSPLNYHIFRGLNAIYVNCLNSGRDILYNRSNDEQLEKLVSEIEVVIQTMRGILNGKVNI